MKAGKRVFIKEMGQFGHVKELDGMGQVKTVTVVTEEGPKVVDVIEKGFNVVTLFASILKLILQFLKPNR